MLTMMFLAAALAGPPPQPKTVGAVIGVIKAWDFAETHGNSEFLEHLLIKGYVSVGPDGSITAREAILARARTRSQAELDEGRVRAAEWRASHPATPEAVVRGNTAIVQWVIAGKRNLISSVDVFTYVDGQWHAAYSQHTTASR